MNEQDDRQDQHKVRPEQIRIEVYMHGAGEDKILSRLSEILTAVKHLEKSMDVDLQDVVDKVAAQTTVVTSTVAAMDGLKAKLDTIIASLPPAVDTAALKALSAAIGANTQSMADAVVRDTIAEEEPAP